MKIMDDYGGGYGADESQEQRRPGCRQEELYVSEDYKIFMIAGTPDSFTHDRNHISVRPFHSLPAPVVEGMRATAKTWTPETSAACDIAIRVADVNLELVDGYSGVTSKFPVSELDEDVREQVLYKIKMRKFGSNGGHDELDPWAKYIAAAPAGADPNVSTGGEISVHKPLTLRKPGGLKL